MRDIEFRGKKTDNGKWVYGYYNWCSLGEEHIIAINNDYDEDRVYDSFGKEAWFEEVIPETVGQYTGIKDIYGKKIYEGDIVEKRFMDLINDAKFIGKIEFHDGQYNIDNEEESYPLFNKVDEIEILGNIYDNPKSLK